MLGALAGVAAAVLVGASVSASGAATPQVLDDSQLNPQSATLGGASPLPTSRTVQHWFGQTLDPHNGVTYGYNMVGFAPGTNSSATIPVDIIPLDINVGGSSYNGTDRVGAVLASPLFQNGDFSTTTAATDNMGLEGPGGALSAGNAGVQLEDATMRAQFNKVGTGYHVILGTPVVHTPITINVPAEHGTQITNVRGITFADVNINWFAAQLQNLNSSLGYIDPTHLPLYVTNEVMLYIGQNPGNCCVIGFHGAGIVPGLSNGPGNGAGTQPVLTYAWASWVVPGTFRIAPTSTRLADWALQDIHAFSHEISEWADDPFVNNFVEPWLTPTAPQYGCSNFLETGDPVVGIGFSNGINTTDQNKYADGTYHPEDEVYLPWFMRTAPNTVSQPTQSPSTNIGRYTLMGDLNPFPGFRAPASGC